MLNESEAKHTDFPRLTNGADSQKFSNCSFCNEDGNQVKKLIASDMAAICDECVDLCKEILAELDEEIKEAPNV
ncbi:hypothetical protein HYR99_15490 [Candidatus Poribacteria bacterium]|nr:hypothetical protein [Candidatus Poribacteria bacterium]